MNCSRCGVVTPSSDAQFCMACGAKLDAKRALQKPTTATAGPTTHSIFTAKSAVIILVVCFAFLVAYSFWLGHDIDRIPSKQLSAEELQGRTDEAFNRMTPAKHLEMAGGTVESREEMFVARKHLNAIPKD